MTEPLASLNGQLIPASQVSVAITDSGFLQGVTIAEQIRTFGGKLFRLQQHVKRLEHCLQIVQVDPGFSLAQIAEMAHDLVQRNHELLSPGDDLGLCIFVTPGVSPTLDPAAQAKPNLVMHTYPVPFQLSAPIYQQGQSLVVTDTIQVPPQCWPPQLKCRSRMHYYLADQQAQQRETGARALLLDAEGFITEASTANVVVYRSDEGLISPPLEKILPGISLAVLDELAGSLDMPMVYRDLTPQEVATADELFLTSTSTCLLPVVKLDGRTIGSGKPGQIFHRLLAAWSELVGLDIAAQADQFCRRPVK